MELTGDSWRFVVDLNISKIINAVTELRAAVWVVRTEAEKASGNIPGLLNVEGEVFRFQELLEEAEDEVAMLHSFLSPDRPRRGLFNAGGKVISFIFGNPDADDFEGLRRTVGEHARAYDEVLHLADQQLTLTRHLQHSAERSSKRVRVLAETVEKALREGFHILGSMEADLNKTIALHTYALSLSSSFRALGLGITEFILKTRRTLAGIEALFEGRFVRDLISPKTLSGLLAGVSGELPEGVAWPHEPGHLREQLYYSVARVGAVPTATGVVAIIDIPLVMPGHNLEMYEVVSLPIPDEQNRTMAAVLESPYYLTSRSGKGYALLQHRDFGLCRKSQIWICPATIPLYHDSTPSCTHNSFKGEGRTQDLCKWRVAVSKPPATWIRNEEEDCWHYSLAEPTRVHIVCRGPATLESREELLMGAGTLWLAPGCSAWTTEYRLFTETKRGETHWALNRTQFMYNKTKPLHLPSASQFDDTEWEAVLADLHKMTEGSQNGSSSDLKDWVEWQDLRMQLMDLRERRREATRRQLLTWGALLGVGIPLACLGLYCCVSRRRRRDTENARESDRRPPAHRPTIHHPSTDD